MSNQNPIPRLPQTGWYTFDEWGEAFGKNYDTIRDWCNKHHIPYIHCETGYALKAEDFYRYAPKVFSDEQKEAEAG